MNMPVELTIGEGVATITMNDPKVRNALTESMITALDASFRALASDPEVRCVVLASSHSSVWCAGGDLGAFSSDKSVIERGNDAAGIMGLFGRISDFPKPTLAAIGGQALAGGMGLAACCDLVIASESATFGTPEINVGLFPFMVTALVMRDIPRKKVNELLMLGQRMAARDAQAIGFVNRVVAEDALPSAVQEWASALSSKSPLLMRMGKQAMVRQRDMALPDALEYLRGQLTVALSSDDLREGVAAFFAKRPPVWSGR